MEQLNNLFMFFSNKATISELISVMKPCILKYVKRKAKANLQNLCFYQSCLRTDARIMF